LVTFFLYFGLAYAAATLLASGLAHVVYFRRFLTTVRAHRVLPPVWAPPVVFAVVGWELAAGGLAAGMLASTRPATLAAPLFGSCALAGCAFWLYVRRLLSRPVRAASCGCSPLASPLTPASLAPSVALALASALGLAAAGFGPEGAVAIGAALPPAVWGCTLAGLLILLPAAAPAPAGGRVR
jgi:hypothetical protein